MTDITVRADNLSKRYLIKVGPVGQNSIAERLVGSTASKSPSSRAGKPTWEEVWSLKDVSFEIRRGEVGMIGRNGGREEHIAESDVADSRADKRSSEIYMSRY